MFDVSAVVIKSAESCPLDVDIRYAKAVVEETQPGTYTIECADGYWTETRSTVQTINCNDDNWISSYSPCVGKGTPTIFTISTYF